MSMIPRPVSGQLQVYLAQDGNVWAINPADGRAYQVSAAAAAPPADMMTKAVYDKNSDGIVDHAALADTVAGGGSGVQKTGDTMTGTLEIDDPGGNGNAILEVFDATNGRSVKLWASGSIYLNAGGTQTNIGPDGNGNLTVGGGHGIVMATGFPATTRITVDTTGGDVIATAIAGPNAGKSVNLTFGKWV